MIGRNSEFLRPVWVLLAALWFVHEAAAEPDHGPEAGLTLEAAHARARAVSPVLVAAREAAAAARGAERQAGAFANPVLVYAHEETSRGGETNREDTALVEQTLEIGGQRRLRKEAARLHREAAEERLRAAQALVAFEVAQAYAQAVAAEHKAMHAREAADAFARAREISAARRKRGDVSGYEDRRTALEAARYAGLHAEAERERRTSRAALAALLAASAEEAAVLAEPLVDPLEATSPREGLATLRAAALERHPAIRAAELSRRAAEVEASLARRERIPDPTLGVGYKREKAAGDPGSWDGFAARVSAPVPLWNRRGGSVEAAEAKARLSAAELRRVRLRVALGVERAWHEFEATSVQVEALRSQLGSEAEAALRAARAAYREGEIALVEWLDAVRAYYEAESAYADLLADHFIRRAALERATGGSLS